MLRGMRFAIAKRMFNIPIRRACAFLILTIAVLTTCAQETTTPSSSGDPGNDDLIESVKEGRLEQVIALLASGVSPDKDSDGNTALCWAVRVNRRDIVETLLANKASVDQEEGDGTTALDVAAAAGRADLVTLLLAKGANANHKDNCGHTTLISAAMGAVVKSLPPLIVTELVSDENLKDLIPLMGYEHNAVAKILLEAGADPNVIAEDCGLTALKIAAMSGDAEFAKVIFTGKIRLTKETRGEALRFAQAIDSVEELQLELDRISDPDEKQKVLNWHQFTSATRREILKMMEAAEAPAHSTR